MANQDYRFDARVSEESSALTAWRSVSESWVRHRLARETPDPAMLDIIVEAMRRGEEADDGEYVFRAVPTGPPAGLRVAYTAAPVDYDGFGTTTLDPTAGTDDRGRPIRKVGIFPKHWEWQTVRYGSGMHVAVTEDELSKFSVFWTMANG